MKTLARSLVVAGAAGALLLVAAEGALAQASANANATAYVVAPFTMINGSGSPGSSSDLAFGSIAAGTGGTVLLTPAGARSVASGGVTLVTDSSHNPGAASFTVSGEGGMHFTVTIPTGPLTITDGSSNNMSVGSFASSPSGTAGMLSSGGSATVTVGGTLTVGANQAAGDYTGQFSVSVDYN